MKKMIEGIEDFLRFMGWGILNSISISCGILICVAVIAGKSLGISVIQIGVKRRDDHDK